MKLVDITEDTRNSVQDCCGRLVEALTRERDIELDIGAITKKAPCANLGQHECCNHHGTGRTTGRSIRISVRLPDT